MTRPTPPSGATEPLAGTTEPAPAPVPTPAKPSLGETARTYAPDFLQEMFANPLDAGYSDAAERRKQYGPPSASSRRFGFGLRTIALVATGLLLAVAYHATVAAKPETSKVQSGLVSDVRQRQASTDGLENEASLLRAEVTRLRNAALDSSDVQQLTNLEALTGLGAVRGSGAVVSMADGPAPVDPVTGQPEGDYLGRVLDDDLQTICNELWRDGAEAISINGQRLISTSAIRRAGDAILVDFVPLSEPYVISAIGPNNMAKALHDSPVGAQYERFIDTYGMHFTITSHDNLSLPAAPDPQLRYATTGSTSAPTTPSPSDTSPAAPSPSAPSPSPSGGH
jgi:uncharacterized protein YlxW (UPF0749 family)